MLIIWLDGDSLFYCWEQLDGGAVNATNFGPLNHLGPHVLDWLKFLLYSFFINSDLLGVKIRENLKFKDAFIFNDQAHQMEVIRAIMASAFLQTVTLMLDEFGNIDRKDLYEKTSFKIILRQF